MEARLNYQKWRADFDNAKSAAEKTHLLAVRAHIRGRQHMHRARVHWKTLARWNKIDWEDAKRLATNGGSVIVELNKADQADIVGEDWRKYITLVEPPPVIIKESLLDCFRRVLRGR